MIPIATQLIDVFYFVIYRAGRGLGWGSHWVSNKCRFHASDCSSVVTSLIGDGCTHLTALVERNAV